MNKKNYILQFAMFSVFAVLLGCDKKAATNSNFEEGLNHYLKTHPVCLLGGMAWPQSEWGDDPRYDALVAAGVLSKAETKKNYFTYSLAGNAQPSSKGANDAGQLCYGTKKVVDIVNFTEPSDTTGAHVSEVIYTWKIVDSPKWAYDPGVQKAYPNIAEDLADDPTGTKHKSNENMVLTHQGWRLIYEQ